MATATVKHDKELGEADLNGVVQLLINLVPKDYSANQSPTPPPSMLG